MTYYFPPPPTVPTIPATLPPNPLNLTGITTDYALITTNDTIVCFGGGYGIYLPLASTVKSKPYNIKLWGSGPVTLVATAPETIDGAAIVVLSLAYQTRIIIPWPSTGWMSV